MYNGFYSDPYSREDIDGDEIYVKNDQIYDNETRSTVKPHALYSLRTTPSGLRDFGPHRRCCCGFNPINEYYNRIEPQDGAQRQIREVQVPTKKDSASYDNLPVTLQNPINATCRCNTIQPGGLNNEIIKDINPGILSKMLKFSNSLTNPTSSESSKFSLNISLTITEIIEILILIMIVVLIAITIRTRSCIRLQSVFIHDKPQPDTTTQSV
jgi:hypothetical protein